MFDKDLFLSLYDKYDVKFSRWSVSDYDVKEYHHSGDCTPDYRKWMYKKFGNEYAVNYLLR